MVCVKCSTFPVLQGLVKLPGSVSRKAKIRIIKDVSGVIKPGR